MTRPIRNSVFLAGVALLTLFMMGARATTYINDEMMNAMIHDTKNHPKLERSSLVNEDAPRQLEGDYGEVVASEKHRLRSPRVGSERLCFEYNTKDGVCTVKDKRLRFEEDFIYVTNLTLVFQDTKMYCLTVHKHPCDFGFNLTAEGARFEMRGESSIAGRQVVLEALEGRVSFDDTSHFNVTGLSKNTNGTMAHGAGASYVGMSGTCGKHIKYRTYGEFDMVPQHKHMLLFTSQMGSMGNARQKMTGGGGRIVIKADSV